MRGTKAVVMFRCSLFMGKCAIFRILWCYACSSGVLCLWGNMPFSGFCGNIVQVVFVVYGAICHYQNSVVIQFRWILLFMGNMPLSEFCGYIVQVLFVYGELV